MALIQTHRFNWMGHEGTESQLLNIGLLRAGDGGNLRYNDYRQRQQALAEMRLRLKVIKGDLGLLPPEETKESLCGGLSPERGETEVGDPSVDNLMDNKTEGGVTTHTSGRRTDRTSKGYLGESDDDENTVYLYPPVPSADEVGEAAVGFAAGVRAFLLSAKETYVSYLDGSEFAEISELKAYNKAHHAAVEQAVEATGSFLRMPLGSEFDLTSLEAAIEERDQIRMKIDALRAAQDPTYAERHIRREELDNSGNPITNVRPVDGDISALSKKFKSVRKSLSTMRELYNKRATEAAKRVQTVLSDHLIAK